MNNLKLPIASSTQPLFGKASGKTASAKPEKQDQSGLNQLRDAVDHVDDLLADQLFYISANEKPPETPRRKASAAIDKAHRAILMAIALVAPGLVGATGVVNAAQNQPSQVAVCQGDLIDSAWMGLANASYAPDVNNVSSRMDFDIQARLFINSLLEAGQACSVESLDSSLAEKLRQTLQNTGNELPAVTAHSIGLDLRSRYIAGLGLSADPSMAELNLAFGSFDEQFINVTPQLQHLNAAQRNELKQAVIRIVDNSLPGSISLNAFDSLMLNYLGGNGFSGVTLEQFARLQNEEDAKRLFTAAVSNPDNFQNLTANERQAFLEYGLSVADSMEFPSNNAILWASMTLVGLGGGGALALLKRKDVFGLAKAMSDLKQARPALIVTNVDQADYERQSETIRLNEQIDRFTTNMADTLREVFRTDPMIREFLLQLFTAEDKLPDAAWFRQVHTYQAVQELIKANPNEKPVGMGTLLQTVGAKVETAARTGNILQINLLEAQAQAKTQQAGKSAAGNQTTQQVLEAERQKMDTLILEAMKLYANRKFSVTALQTEQNKLETRLNELVDKMAALQEQGKTVQDAEMTYLLDEHGRTERDSQLTQKLLKDAQLLAAHVSGTMEEYIEPLRQYRVRIVQALQDQDFSKGVQELQKIKDETGALKDDPKLTEALREQRLENYLQEQQRESRRIEEEVDAAVAQELALLQQQQKNRS